MWHINCRYCVQSAGEKEYKLLITRNIGISDLLMSAWRCTGNAVIFRYSMGSTGTYDPLIGEKAVFFEFSKRRLWPKQKQFPIDRNLEDEKINTLRRVFWCKIISYFLMILKYRIYGHTWSKYITILQYPLLQYLYINIT